MNKFGKIGLITAGALVALVGGGAILYNTVPSLHKVGTNNQANIGLGGGVIGDITVNTDNTNKQYLALINPESKSAKFTFATLTKSYLNSTTISLFA